MSAIFGDQISITDREIHVVTQYMEEAKSNDSSNNSDCNIVEVSTQPKSNS